MSFRRIEYFLSVAKHLNFTKAARECYVAQAAVSQQIKQFEEELGFTLFDRGGASVRLTPAGEYFARQCRSVMDQYTRAVQRARGIADGEDKSLRIGFNGPYTNLPFINYLREYRESSPDVFVHIQEGEREDLIGQLLRGDLDVLVMSDYGLPQDDRFDLLQLNSCRSKFMIGPVGPLAGRRYISPAELAGQTILRLDGTGPEAEGQQMEDYYSRLGLGDNPMRKVKTYSEAVFLVEAGLGIAPIPVGADDRLPKDVTIFEIEGDTFWINTVAVRVTPPESITADDFFGLMREKLQETGK